MNELNITHEYLEIAGAGHGDVIGKGMPKIFESFEKQQKKGDDKGKKENQGKRDGGTNRALRPPAPGGGCLRAG
jgi:hypothetical protein